MNRLLSSVLVMIALAQGVHAQTAPAVAPDARELTSLLNEFLAGASGSQLSPRQGRHSRAFV